jgi:hypothetical protein
VTKTKVTSTLSTPAALEAHAVSPNPVKPSVVRETERRLSGSREPARNLQYKLATERLKREILEGKMREEELRERGRPKSTSAAVTVSHCFEKSVGKA